jgi:hypothetical protein
MIEKKSKKFFYFILFIFLISIIITYYRYVVNKDFLIFVDESEFYQSIEE